MYVHIEPVSPEAYRESSADQAKAQLSPGPLESLLGSKSRPRKAVERAQNCRTTVRALAVFLLLRVVAHPRHEDGQVNLLILGPGRKRSIHPATNSARSVIRVGSTRDRAAKDDCLGGELVNVRLRGSDCERTCSEEHRSESDWFDEIHELFL